MWHQHLRCQCDPNSNHSSNQLTPQVMIKQIAAVTTPVEQILPNLLSGKLVSLFPSIY